MEIQTLYLELLRLHGGRKKAGQEMNAALLLRERQPLVVACIPQQLGSTAPWPPSPTRESSIDKKKNRAATQTKTEIVVASTGSEDHLATM